LHRRAAIVSSHRIHVVASSTSRRVVVVASRCHLVGGLTSHHRRIIIVVGGAWSRAGSEWSMECEEVLGLNPGSSSRTGRAATGPWEQGQCSAVQCSKVQCSAVQCARTVALINCPADPPKRGSLPGPVRNPLFCPASMPPPQEQREKYFIAASGVPGRGSPASHDTQGQLCTLHCTVPMISCGPFDVVVVVLKECIRCA
jgi:hypothetical protein